jgi:hypothetical protein
VLLSGAAHADPPADIAGLFMQSCMQFAGEPTALRAWAKASHLPPVPEPARTIFLRGAPGVVFDASLPPQKYVVVSSDDGLCSVVTNDAVGTNVLAALEDDFRKIGIAFRTTSDRDDERQPGIHERVYSVSLTVAGKPTRSWRIQTATVKDGKGGQAMLSAAPE